MKKMVSLLMAAVLVFSLTGCGGEAAQPADSTTTPTSQTENSVPTDPGKPTEPSGGVTDPSEEVTQPSETVTEPTVDPSEPSEPVEDPTVPSEPTHEHSYTTAVTVPNCAEDGYTTYSCACGDSYVSDRVNAKGHSYAATVTAPTCTAEGYTTYTCDCGESYVADKTNAKGHSFGQWITLKEPTTSAAGKAERKCAACSAKEERTLDKIIENHTHSYKSSVTKQPTCTAEGVKTYTCSCGGSYTESVAATGHNYSAKVTKQPTCNAEGVKTYTCSKCSGFYNESIAQLSHSYAATVVKPTCSGKGYTKHICSSCGHSYHDAYTNAAGHSYTSKVTAATCTTKGYTTYTCSKCSNSYKGNYTNATGHINTKTETKEATCATAGYTKVTCADCGTVISNTTIPAGQHNYKETKLSDAAKKCYDKWLEHGEYLNWTDWVVDFCEGCCSLKKDTIRFAYSDYEAAEIMLGYVNDLRAELYGTHAYDLQLDTTLIELAKIRAEEISVFFSHAGGTYTEARENIHHGQANIYDQFQEWYESSVHYNTMVDTTSSYFGYAIYKSETGAVFGVQLFWAEGDEDVYNEYK